MQTDKQFSLQSTTIAQNPQSELKQLKLSKIKSEKLLFEKSVLQINESTNPMQMLKTALKLLQLNSSQQQVVILQVNQFKQQNNRSKSIRNNSARKRIPSIDSKRKPPLPVMNTEKKPKFNQLVKKISPQQSLRQTSQFIVQPTMQLTTRSSIIKTSQQAQNIVKFFPQNSVKSFDLLFKASQHKFNLKQFFKLYGYIQNIMFICQTNKGKVLGAYSSLSHEFTGKGSFDDKWGQKVKDPSKSSFTFSLNNNDKFEMKKEQHAIYRWRDKKYLLFGDWQFAICDASNINKNCRTDNVNSTYFNPRYKNSKESWLKLNGNQDAWFTTKEWQAWKVQFETTEK